MQVIIEPLEQQTYSEPATVEELMNALHLVERERVNHDELSQTITRARAMAESMTNSPIVQTEFKATAYNINSYFIEFDHNMTGISVTGISYVDGIEIEKELIKSTNYNDNPRGIYLTQATIDQRFDHIIILYSDGPFVTPYPIKQAVITIACNLWKGEEVSQTVKDTLAPFRRQNL